MIVFYVRNLRFVENHFSEWRFFLNKEAVLSGENLYAYPPADATIALQEYSKDIPYTCIDTAA